MSKTKTIYVCQSCGTTSPKWMGKCGNCGAWNSFVEEIVDTSPKARLPPNINGKSKPQLLTEISTENRQRLVTSDAELNRVLGGGIVPGSVVLIGGEPGIGKSALINELKKPMLEKKGYFMMQPIMDEALTSKIKSMVNTNAKT